MRIAVIGATGVLGAPVARALLDAGYTVRVLGRNPGKAREQLGAAFEYSAADVTKPDTLAPALANCDGLHVNLRGTNSIESYHAVEAEGARQVVAAAARAGVGRLSYVSGAGDVQRARANPLIAAKLAAAEAVVSGGVPYMLLKPTHFMESLPMFVRAGRATIIGHQPHRYHYLAAADYARMVARAFGEPAAANRELTFFGPEAYTMREALEIYCRAAHPGIPIGRMPIWLFRTLATCTRNREMQFVGQLFSGFTLIGESGDPTATNALLGAPTVTLAHWCTARQRAPSDA
jgi:uncharacterized protein YbjT (DUF2867 family)